MEAIKLGKAKTQQITQFINFGNQNYDNDNQKQAIEFYSNAIAIYPANLKTNEEINGDIPDRNEILTKLGMLFTKYGTQLDPTGVHLFKQSLIYAPDDVEANYYLGKILFNNGNIYEANLYLNKVIDNIDENDKLYNSTKKALEEINNQDEKDLPIFATDFIIGQALSHTMLTSPIGTFVKMSFDKIENKYNDSVQLFPTDQTVKKLNKIRDFNSNHGFKQAPFEEFLPANLPLFEVKNNLSLFIDENYTLINQGAEIYDVCGINVPPELSFNFYKLVNNDTGTIAYLLLTGKSPLEIKDEQLRTSDDFDYQETIFDDYKTNVSYDTETIKVFMLAVAKDYFNDTVTKDNIEKTKVWGIKDAGFEQTFDKNDDFTLDDSRLEILIETNIEK
ncbi:hypothetical protein MOO46_06635 [Apilactobacillus apisilvae]|uniref:TPR repeat-containing protein n=1 Tax=Apilactobacillus apisilvae TaxID=2923364 RepID=A0ABY4PHE0_9LACO|nr:hypothetical protein [Apilactobacillus apisilvae]UQS84915.1 hypothetical protein MOO46_06635 [Apilactobacillus apisilvae]